MWRAQAACVGQSAKFFYEVPRRGNNQAHVLDALTAEARAVCEACPVKDECLAEAMQCAADDHAVWGGTHHLDRRRMRGLDGRGRRRRSVA